MERINRVFPCRIEELSTIGGFVLGSFKTDKADFGDYTDFDDPFEANFQTGLDGIRALINPGTITAELAKVSLRLETNVAGLRGKMDKLENYVRNAGDALTVLPKNFGISAVRKKISSGDVEGLDLALGTVETNINNNLAALTAKGYKADPMFTDMKTAHKAITDDNQTQNQKTNDRENLAGNNMTAFNNFYKDFVAKTASQGKNIYKTTNPGKVDGYNISALMRRIRQEQLKTKLLGSVRDANSNPVFKAAVELKPIDGSKGKKTTSKADGSYELKSLKAGIYNLVATAGSLTSVQQVTLNTGDAPVVDVVVK